MRFALVNPRINDIFIAYSPADANFARLLDAALRKEDADPWIDYDDMIDGGDYLSQFKEGIRRADVFVLVTSEMTLQSPEMLEALELATLLNKLVVWVTKTPDLKVLETSDRWSQVHLTDPWHSIHTPTWETAFEQLAKTIIHLQIYLRFVARTIEWERRDRPTSLLLTADDLGAVVERRQWLEAQPFSQHLKITPRQTDFLNQSIRQVKADQQTAYLNRTQPDIFISYSRKDREFVKDLATALIDNSWRIWVDWENIPVATDWREEVHDGIRNAHTFLMVISPDSIISEPCRWELRKAQEYQKRIIPIVCRDKYNRELFRATGLASINYISCTRQPFEAALKTLLETLQTDLEDTKIYNRLLVRAHEWTERGRQEGLLMTAPELGDIRRWHQKRSHYRRPDNKTTALPLLPLQEEYINASRKHIQTRRNTARVLTIFGMSLVSFLAILTTTTTVSEIKALVASLDDRQELDALVTALKAGRRTQRNSWLLNLVNPQLKSQATTVLHDAILKLREVNRLTGHTGSVIDMVFSPDGQTLASVGKDRQLRIWDITTGHMSDPLFGLGHLDDVVTVVYNPQGNLIATGSYDGSVKVWRYDVRYKAALFAPDGSTGTYPYRTPQTLPRQHQDWVTKVAFNQAGNRLASASFDGTVHLWERTTTTADEEERFGNLHVLSHDGAPVFSLAFSPAGEDRLVTGDVAGVVKLWNRAGELLQQVDYGDGVVTTAFSPDGQQVAIAGNQGKVLLWDLATNTTTFLPPKHDGRIFQVVYSPNGEILASASEDATVELWNVKTKSAIATLRGHQGRVYRVAFYQADLLASAGSDGTVRLWSTKSQKQLSVLEGHQDEVYSIAFSPKEKEPLLASGSKDSLIRLWKVNGPIQPLPHDNRVYDVRFRPDGNLIAASGQNTINLWRPDGTDTGVVLGEKNSTASQDESQNLGDLQSIDYSPDGTILAAGNADGIVYLWQLPGDKELQKVPQQSPIIYWKAHQPISSDPAGVLALRYRPNPNPQQRWLVTAGSDGKIQFWSANLQSVQQSIVPSSDPDKPPTLDPLLTLGEEPKASIKSGVTDISFSANGMRLAASSRSSLVRNESGKILIWEISANPSQKPDSQLMTKLGRKEGGHKGDILSVAFDPTNPDLLASGGEDGTIKLWNLNRRQRNSQPHYLIKTLRYSDAITDLSYSSDGQFLMSSSRDGSIHLWKADNGQLISILQRHTGEVSSLEFDPQDNNILASASVDSRVLLWNLWPGNSLLAQSNHQNILQELMRMGCKAGQQYLESQIYLQPQAPKVSNFEAQRWGDEKQIKEFCESTTDDD